MAPNGQDGSLSSHQHKRLTILCVCTGNVCRSPAAERLLASALGPDVAVTSAGTHALVGQPIEPPVDDLLRAAGADPDGFVARPLTEALLRPTDLVLALTQQHRRAVVKLWPKAVRHTFTLKEFARLLELCDLAALPDAGVGDRIRAAVPRAAGQRRRVPDPALDNVVDPYRGSEQVHAAAFGDIERAVHSIARVLVPGPASSQPVG